MRKWIIISALSLCLVIGVWTYLCLAGPAWISDFAKGTTRTVAASMGVHLFDEQQSADVDPKAKKETVANLPDGYYVYVGNRPMQAEPKWVVVNPGGTISWLNKGSSAPPSAPSITTPAANTSVTTAEQNKQAATQGQFEACDYPVIKWKAKPLPGPNGAIAQLHTTYEQGAPGDKGTVKYRLTVFKAPGNGTREVQLLDANGFKLLQFNVSGFLEIPNSELMESRDSFVCDENLYRQARDYSVN